MTDEPRLQAEPREGVPDVIDTLPAFREYCSALASSHGSLAADAERASGFRYGHDDWLVQFKRDGAGIGLLDPQALAAEGADWNDFNRAVGDAVWILHDSLQDLPGFVDLGLQPKRLFDTEIAARLLGLKRFGLSCRYRALSGTDACERAFRGRLVVSGRCPETGVIMRRWTLNC